MTVSVYMMSGNIISVDIFDGFRIRNLRNEVYLSLRESDNRIENIALGITDSDRFVFSKIGNDNEETDDYDFVEDGDAFRVFVKPIEDIPSQRVRLSLGHNGVICLRNYEGFLIKYYGWNLEDRIDEFLDTERVVGMPNRRFILEVDIDEDGYEIMRRDIRESADENDDDLDDLDSNERTFDIFFDRFMRIGSFDDVDVVDIVYLNENEED